MSESKPRLLIHACCAPCAPYVVSEMKKDFDITLYFYNPNIHPYSEYERRANELVRFSIDAGVDYIIGKNDIKYWIESVKGLENEPEKGERCTVCFSIRLKEAMRKAEELGIPYVTTLLTVSPHKLSEQINAAGRELQHNFKSVTFLEKNFKKQDGYKKTRQMGAPYQFYQQDYCGCVFSLRDKRARDAERLKSDNKNGMPPCLG
ncbi:epoxyqueuosine reductase QueH [bacterium]|nr:epoxyqueuosine reductase QueH [bacterium]